MLTPLEFIGLITCLVIGFLAFVCTWNAIINFLIRKVLKTFINPYRCPHCGYIPLGYRSKYTNRKIPSDFCPHCGRDLTK